MTKTIYDRAKVFLEALPEGVRLVVATKYAQSKEELLELYRAGVRDFGENRIQTFAEHKAWLEGENLPELNWHFIGHLQKNKVNKTLNQFSLIQTVDSLELARAISELNIRNNSVQNVLIQVNITEEEQKSGFLKHDLLEVFPELLALKGLKIKGLMCFGHPSMHEDMCLGVFSELKALSSMLEGMFSIQLEELSMGMSHDYVHALKFNVTIIRIGQAIFKEAPQTLVE